MFSTLFNSYNFIYRLFPYFCWDVIKVMHLLQICCIMWERIIKRVILGNYVSLASLRSIITEIHCRWWHLFYISFKYDGTLILFYFHFKFFCNNFCVNLFPHKDAFWRLCSRPLLKTLTKGETAWSIRAISTFATVLFSTLFNNYTIIYRDFSYFCQDVFKVIVCCRFALCGLQ